MVHLIKIGYKYVIEQLKVDNKYYNDILSSLHNFVKVKFYKINITTGGSNVYTRNNTNAFNIYIIYIYYICK